MTWRKPNVPVSCVGACSGPIHYAMGSHLALLATSHISDLQALALLLHQELLVKLLHKVHFAARQKLVLKVLQAQAGL